MHHILVFQLFRWSVHLHFSFGVSDQFKLNKLLSGQLRWVRNCEQLRGGLAILNYLIFGLLPHILVLYILQVYLILVGHVVKNIEGFFCLLASLLIPKYKVYPIIDKFRGILTFKGYSLLHGEFIRVLVRPSWNRYIVDAAPFLSRSKIIVIQVQEDFREAEKFGGQLSYVILITNR